MFSCPHCNKPGVRGWAKYWAGPADPAVCDYCKKASCISSSIQTASTLLYVIAGFLAFMTLALTAARIHNCSITDCWTSIHGPSAAMVFFSLLLFYVAVEAAKVFWAPLKALSDVQVEKKKSTANKIAIVLAILFIVALLLEKCGF